MHMEDLRWSLGALSRHQSGDGSQAADDEREPEGCTNDQYNVMRGMMTRSMHPPCSIGVGAASRGAACVASGDRRLVFIVFVTVIL